MCEPPCRSRPSTRRRCAQFGQVLTVASEKKFGTAQRHTSSAVRMIASAFHRVKYNIELTRQVLDRAPPETLARRAVFPGGVGLLLGRLALGAHAGDHLAHLPHPDSVGNLE